MPLIRYVEKRFSSVQRRIIDQANQIIRQYQEAGYDLTLRQIYYQFVSRDWFPEAWADRVTGSTNNEKSYKNLGIILSDARRAGLIDWNAIVDRTRNVRIPASWGSPKDIVSATAQQFAVDWWFDQPYRVEVWVEKDALLGVVQVACQEWHCPYFSCRGYTSDSEAWGAAMRLDAHCEEGLGGRGQDCLILHLGDHDPSGLDISRDIFDRLTLFSRHSERIEVRRIALNMDQVNELNPPPNPAKSTDSRFADYRRRFGESSWELDALPPEYITGLIGDEMRRVIEPGAWSQSAQEQLEGRRRLAEVSRRWDELTGNL